MIKKGERMLPLFLTLCAPTSSEGRALRPSDPGELSLNARGCAPEASRQTWLLPPWGGRSAPPPRVTFPSRGKSPKARQGLPPFGIPPMRKIRPYWCCAALAPGLPSATKNRPICHFRFVDKSALFSPSVSSRKHSLLSIRGAASALPPRMLEGLIDGERYR